MSYTPDKKEIRRVYSQGTTGEPINEWADEFDRWHAAELAAAEKRGAVKALREAAEKDSITIPDVLGYKVQAVAVEDLLSRADQEGEAYEH